MTITEKKMNLFDAPDDYYLAHCISADFALGAGIAVEFNRRFNMKNRLNELYPNYLESNWYDSIRLRGYISSDCIMVGRVFNLVTKTHYWNKPTLTSMRYALQKMKQCASEYDVTKIAMPKIGCGLDRLKWDDVKAILNDVFADTDVEILVCYK